jgi:hypothetical protein
MVMEEILKKENLCHVQQVKENLCHVQQVKENLCHVQQVKENLCHVQQVKENLCHVQQVKILMHSLTFGALSWVLPGRMLKPLFKPALAILFLGELDGEWLSCCGFKNMTPERAVAGRGEAIEGLLDPCFCKGYIHDRQNIRWKEGSCREKGFCLYII